MANNVHLLGQAQAMQQQQAQMQAMHMNMAMGIFAQIAGQNIVASLQELRERQKEWELRGPDREDEPRPMDLQKLESVVLAQVAIGFAADFLNVYMAPVPEKKPEA